MTRTVPRRSATLSRHQVVDLLLGLILSIVAATRLLLGADWTVVSWGLIAVASMACAAIAIRQRLPIIAFTLAIAGGVLAMSMDLRNSAADLFVGVGVIVVTLGRQMIGFERAGERLALSEIANDVRQRLPLVALAMVAIAGMVLVPVDVKEAPSIAILAAAFALGSASDRTTTLVLGLAAAAVLAVGSWLLAADAWTGPATPVPLIAAALVGAAMGETARGRRELAISAEARARQTRQAHEEESRRRVVEERLRIARDVHDLVAHHLAVVNVQAGVSSHLLRDRPEAAAEALGHVRTASGAALDELGALLGVLRGSGDSTAPLEPTPRLANLEQLLASFGAAGRRVDLTMAGPPRSLPPDVDVSAYRLIQESLTNASRYGIGPTRLLLTYLPDQLSIVVRNTPKGPSSQQTDRPVPGYGLTGMRERVAALGGTLETGPAPTGEFVVNATLPAPRDGPAVTR